MAKNRSFGQAISAFVILALMVIYHGGCGGGGGSAPVSGAKDIIVFSFANPSATGTIDQSKKSIVVNVPAETNVTVLVATFSTTGASVRVGAVVQTSGVTSNDFTSPVTYTVTAADGSTQSYAVKVRAGALPTQWAKTMTTGTGSSFFISTSVAPDGSVYAAGYISGTGTYDFGNSVTAAGTFSSNNVLLVKYNSSGVAQWAQTVTAGISTSSFQGVSGAPDGSVYAAGYISGTGTYDFGNSVTAAGTYTDFNMVLVKYNSSGVAQWARTATTGSNYSSFSSISVAPDGSVYASGSIYGTGTYGFGNSVTAAGTYTGHNSVLVKYDSSGVAQWAKTVTAGSSQSSFYGVSVGQDGSVYVAGAISGAGAYDFGNGVTAAGQYSGGSNIVLVKYDSSGVAQWAKTSTTGNNNSYFRGVSVAQDGSVYVAGYIFGTGTYDFGNSATAAGSYNGGNLVLVKYNSSGVAQWAQTVTAGGNQSSFSSVSAAPDGSVYAAGYIYGTGAFAFGGNVAAAGAYSGNNIVLVKYDSSGVAQLAKTIRTGNDYSIFISVSTASDGSVYAAGNIRGIGAYNFGNSVTAAGTYVGENVLLVKYGGDDSALVSSPFTAFSFTSPSATGIIDQSEQSIVVTVPAWTDVTALAATFLTTGVSVRVGNTVQTSGITPNDFTNPVTYTVTGANGSTRSYTVTVRVGALPAQWARTVTAGSDISHFSSVSAAPDGSVYAAGLIYGTGTYAFGNSVTAAGTNSAGGNIVLVKYSSSGAAQWARTVTAGSSNSYFFSVSAAPDGSVYAAGYIYGTGTYDFGNSVTAAGTSGNDNIVLVKYDSSGAAQWARTVTAGSSSSYFFSVSAAPDGSVYAAGSIFGTGAYAFGGNVTAAGTNNGFNVLLVKYNSSGTAQWARTVTAGSNSSFFHSVSAAPDGSVCAAGYMYGSDFGTVMYGFGNSVFAGGAFNGTNVLLVKYNSSGVAQWAQTVSAGSSDSAFTSVSAAPDGSVYAAGRIGSGAYPTGFGNSVTAAGTYNGDNIVLVKYDSSGAAQWARTVTAGSSSSYFSSLSVAPDGSVYAAGHINGTATYNFGNSVTAAGTSNSDNIVLVKYDSSGAAQFARTVTAGSSASGFYGVSAASGGPVYAAGSISGTGACTFGGSVTAAGTNSNDNTLLVKYY